VSKDAEIELSSQALLKSLEVQEQLRGRIRELERELAEYRRLFGSLEHAHQVLKMAKERKE